MQNKIVILVIVACFSVVAAMFPFIVTHDVNATATFEAEATANLGTDNFEIWSWDGVLQAVTPDGQKYPTDQEMSQYFHNKLVMQLSILGVAGTIFGVIFFGSYIYFNKTITQQEAEEVKKGDTPRA